MTIKRSEDQGELRGQLSVSEAGARGGRATLRNKGIGFFSKIGRKGGRRTAELYHDMLAEFGRRGGRPTRPSLEDAGEGNRK